MELPEAIDRFRMLRNNLLEAVRVNMEVAAMDAIEVIVTRIVQTGIDFNGVPFRPYSEAYTKDKRKHYRGFVDFKLTGDMWQSLGIVEEQVTATEARVLVKGRDTFSNDKLEWNSFGHTVTHKPAKVHIPLVSPIYGDTQPPKKRRSPKKEKPSPVSSIKNFVEGRGDLLGISKDEKQNIQDDFAERMEEFVINTLEK